MNWEIPLADVRLPINATDAVAAVLRRGWLSMGPEVGAFESEFAALMGTDHAVACSSGTAALQLALAAAGIGPGDEVVMPSLTFVAGANVVRMLGATPVFADVEGEQALALDPERAQAAISPRTRAIVAMHYGGHPTAGHVVDVARDAGVPLIEDAAHAPGAGRTVLGRCGGWGLAGCFSFFANKNIPIGEGGMLTTNDAGVAASARRLRSHGMTSTTWERWVAAGALYEVEEPGWNLRLDEQRAAMGRALIDVLDAWNERRASAVAYYRQRLADVDGVSVPYAQRPDADAHSAHHLMSVLLAAGIDRGAIATALAGEGIQTSVHYRPVHTFNAYAGEHPHLERTEAIWPRLLTLPLFPHIRKAQIDQVVDALSAAISQARRTGRSALATPGAS